MIRESHFDLDKKSSIRKVIRMLREDNRTRMRFMNKPMTLGNKIWSLLTPNMCVVILHRLSHYFYCKRLGFLARFFYVLNIMLFGCEITPPSFIGPGLHIVHVVGVVIHAKIGKNVCIFGDVALGGSGDRRNDIGWLGGPVIGDNVKFGFGSKVMACVQIGNNAFVGAMSLVTKDVPENAVVFGIPAKVMKIRTPTDTDDDLQET